MNGTSVSGDQDYYRRESIGAFAHDLKSPLTSVRMVLDLAARERSDGLITLDAGLADLLRSSLDDLHSLVEDLQEMSRIERGLLQPGRGPCDAAEAVSLARSLLGDRLRLNPGVIATSEGPWDLKQLAGAIAGFARAADRCGAGDGEVVVSVCPGDDSLCLEFRSGEPAGDSRPLTAEAGFSFFRARQVVLALGGAVACERTARHATISVFLPLTRE